MPKCSAGLLLFRRTSGELEVLLVHPGGPFWARKDAGAWSIPKGEIDAGEEPLAAAKREFAEETGCPAPDGPTIDLDEAVQPSRKVVTAFAIEAAFDLGRLAGATVEIEWPPRSGRRNLYPEIDRAEWFSLGDAREKLLVGQRPFLDRLTLELSRERG